MDTNAPCQGRPEACSYEQTLLERASFRTEHEPDDTSTRAIPSGDVPRSTKFVVFSRRENAPHPARRATDKTLMPVDSNKAERMLLTLVFTDIVGSTEMLERVGDRLWCSLLLHHRQLVREHLDACCGREVDAAGDGFFLAFDRPSRAIVFALEVRDALRTIGIEVRVGIHAGECEVIGKRVEGLAVHTAARVAGAATAGEILVSNTVRDLVAGSEHRFVKHVVRVLKGLSQPRDLFALGTVVLPMQT